MRKREKLREGKMSWTAVAVHCRHRCCVYLFSCSIAAAHTIYRSIISINIYTYAYITRMRLTHKIICERLRSQTCFKRRNYSKTKKAYEKLSTSNLCVREASFVARRNAHQITSIERMLGKHRSIQPNAHSMETKVCSCAEARRTSERKNNVASWDTCTERSDT